MLKSPDNQQPHKDSPFQEPLQPIQEKDLKRFYQLGNNPEKIVRRQSMVEGGAKTTAKYYSELKDTFYRMREKFGVAVPDIDIVIGKDQEQQAAVFMLVDKIYGKSLDQFDVFPPEMAEKLDEFYANFLEATLDAYKNKLPIWADFRSSQIMYSHKKGEDEDQVYITDVGSRVIDANHRYREHSYDSYFKGQAADYFIASWEQQFRPPVTLEKSRTQLKTIRNFIDQNDKSKQV